MDFKFNQTFSKPVFQNKDKTSGMELAARADARGAGTPTSLPALRGPSFSLRSLLAHRKGRSSALRLALLNSENWRHPASCSRFSECLALTLLPGGL